MVRMLLNLITLLSFVLTWHFYHDNELLRMILERVQENSGGYVKQKGFYLTSGSELVFIEWWIAGLFFLFLTFSRLYVRIRIALIDPLTPELKDSHSRYPLKSDPLNTNPFDDYDEIPDTLNFQAVRAKRSTAGNTDEDTLNGVHYIHTAGVDGYVALLNDAMYGRRGVRIVYRNSQDEESTRVVEPVDVYRSGGVYYMQGFCHVRNETRTFRVDRIVSLYPSTEETLDQTDETGDRVICRNCGKEDRYNSAMRCRHCNIKNWGWDLIAHEQKESELQAVITSEEGDYE